MDDLYQSCVEALRPYSRIMHQFKNHFIQKGRFVGKIKLINLTKEEQGFLSGIMGKDCYYTELDISVTEWIRGFERGRFGNLDFKVVLEYLFQTKLISKPEQRRKESEGYTHCIQSFLTEESSATIQMWLGEVLLSKKGAHTVLFQLYKKSPKNLMTQLKIISVVADILNSKRELFWRLPALAAEGSKDPHALDERNDAGKLLLYYLAFMQKVSLPKTAEEKNQLLEEVGICSDEISNFSVCSGLIAYTDAGVHLGWQEFYNRRDPIYVSLYHLKNIRQINSPSGVVYVVENPTILSSLLSESKHPLPLICTYGQPKLATLILLDLLAKENTKIYYAGDFDPEGIGIADRLKQRYKENLTLWGYTKEHFEKTATKVSLTKERIEKLSSIQDSELKKIGQLIERSGKCGYQETLLDFYIGDVGTINF